MHTTLITKDGELYLTVEYSDNLVERKVLAGWESFTGWYWFQTEPAEEDLCWGFVQGMEEEWGYFSPAEIEAHYLCWKIDPCDLPHAGRREVPAENLCAEPTNPVGDPSPSDWRQQAADWQRLK